MNPTDEKDNSLTDFTRVYVPWLVAAASLVLYLATMNQWVTLGSLPFVAKVAGWDWWSPTLDRPLLYALTYPVRFLTENWQVPTLNFLAALGAALTLRVLARSVALLPHDRTREQRQREKSEYSLLSMPGSWIPPLLAVAVCGLQLTFWENATSATGEMLDLLIFAYCLRCLLEYRVWRRDGWLARLALVYGLGLTNNWALLVYFPFFLAAVLALKRKGFFERKFLLQFGGLGLVGLLLYLALPLAAKLGGDTGASFWQLLKTELNVQRQSLFLFPLGRVLLLSLTSILPALFLLIRWPASFGETSAAGSVISNLMFRVVHVFLLGATIWAAFDPAFSPRHLGFGLPFLTFYYLGALAAGYYCGYVLLVFGRSTGKAWERPSAMMRLLNGLVVLAVGLAVLATPILLLRQNLPPVRAANGPALKLYARHLADSVPAREALILSDLPHPLLLVSALRPGRSAEFVPVDTRFLSSTEYHRKLQKLHPRHWPAFAKGVEVPDLIGQGEVARLVTHLARSNRVFYLHPSFGRPFLETAYLRPAGLAAELIIYPPNTIAPPPPSKEQWRENQTVWERAGEILTALGPGLKLRAGESLEIGRSCSASASAWGVTLQRLGQVDDAARYFDLALKFNPENEAARINQRANRKLRGQPVEDDKGSEERIFRRHPTWNLALTAYGPVDDAGYCYRLGLSYARFNLLRQSANEIQRALAFDPANAAYALSLGDIFLRAALPDYAAEVAAKIHAADTATEIRLASLKAMVQVQKKNLPAAEKILLDARAKFPGDASLLETLAKAYLLSGRNASALAVVEEHLKLEPKNFRLLVNQGALNIQLKNYQEALTSLDAALKLQPTNAAALLNRATARRKLGQFAPAEQDYLAAKKSAPATAAPSYGLAEIALAQKQTAAAVQHIEQALKLDSSGSAEAKFWAEKLKELKAAKP
ncbi:MAG: tetratricopeptide repeat protein [Verrucomicrobia bacterium]|nr:tetratricopeptide repeat protein [Verrucomicrobiota bacterium]